MPDRSNPFTSFVTRHRVGIIIGAVALGVYLPGAWWGAPHATGPDRTHAWGVDDETPLGPLAELRGIRAKSPDRNLGYPLMHPFLVGAAYTPYLGYLWATRQLDQPTSTYPFGLADPVRSLRTLTLIAHLVSVLMAAGVVVAAYHVGATWWDQSAGVWSALLAMTAFPMFYYARTGNVDVPALFFIALATVAYVRCLRVGYTIRRAAWLGIWAGLSLATKESALGVLLGMPLGLLWCADGRSPLATLRSRKFWTASSAGLVAALLTLAVGGGFAVDPERYLAHLAFLSGRLETLATAGTPVVATFPYTLAGHFALAAEEIRYLADAMTPVGLALALAGVLTAAFTARRQLLLLLPGATYLIYMFFTLRAGQLRYVMPLAFYLAFFAGWIVSQAWQRRQGKIPRALRYAGLVTLGLALLHGASLTHEMLNDSRYAAGAWLAARTRPGDVVEFFGATQKLPPLDADVAAHRAAEYRGMYDQPTVDDAAVRAIVEGWRERQPAFVLLIPDHTSRPAAPYSFTMPPQLFATLEAGTGAYRLAASFQTPPLIPWLIHPALDYPTVNPPVRIYEPNGGPETRDHPASLAQSDGPSATTPGPVFIVTSDTP